jgi:hypothetical protein
MTQERAKEISEIIDWESGGCLISGNKRPLNPPVTIDERNEIVAVWKTMPGHSCFHDAVRRIANGISGT